MNYRKCLSFDFGTISFIADYKGVFFAYSSTTHVKLHGGKKVLEVQPRPDGEFWMLKRRKEKADHDVDNKVVIDVVVALNGQSFGYHSNMSLSLLKRLFRENEKVSN